MGYGGLRLVLTPENEDEETLMKILEHQAQERGGLRVGGSVSGTGGFTATRVIFDAGSWAWVNAMRPEKSAEPDPESDS